MSRIARAAALTITAALFAGGGTAAAQTVKVSGEHTDLRLTTTVKRSLAKHHVTMTPVRSARTVGNAVRFPLTNGRWDFAERDGYLNHFKGDTGLRFKRKGARRSVTLLDPRIIVASGTHGYVTARLANERFKVFRFKLTAAKTTQTASAQTISNIALIVTQAAATRINRATAPRTLRPFTQIAVLSMTIRKPATPAAGTGTGTGTPTQPATGTTGTGAGTGAGTVTTGPGTAQQPGATATVAPAFSSMLPAGTTLTPIAPALSVDTDGDGSPDAGVVALPLNSGSIDANAMSGAVKLDGGLLITVPGLADVRIENPEVLLGADQGVYAHVNGVRVRLADIDASTLRLTAMNGTLTLADLDARLSVAGAGVLNALLGTLSPLGIAPGGPLLHVQLSAPAA